MSSASDGELAASASDELDASSGGPSDLSLSGNESDAFDPAKLVSSNARQVLRRFLLLHCDVLLGADGGERGGGYGMRFVAGNIGQRNEAFMGKVRH